MGDFCMPNLGSDLESGTLVEWRVRPGDAVKRGDVVALVETDKAAVEVEVWEDGVVEALLVEPPARVLVGTPLARIGSGSPELPSSTDARRLRASPAARVLAQERGVDLAGVTPSGPGGAITREDVARTAAPPAQPTPERSADRGAALRRAIAAAMARSKREVPHYYLRTTVDMRRARAWLDGENASRPVASRLLPIALLVKAVAASVAEVPEMNGFFVDGAFRPSAEVHVGIAISLRGGGLVAPAVRHADRLAVPDLMHAIVSLAERVRAGTLRSSELADATITVSSLGDNGVEAVAGVIHPPQVALVGFGSVVSRPWAEGSQVLVAPVVVATLSADHRASDGHRGGLFLAAIDRRLQEPVRL
jgi:pyruvate dehydrogenase E2 component (dihydrolipoamide acetyltransferase)